MTEEQKKLEGLLLDHIEYQVKGSNLSEKDTVSETAAALIELWRLINTYGY